MTNNFCKEVGIDFKCLKNGLYRHPTICSKFIQCDYFGTAYEKVDIMVCPNGLYFNEKLGYCDYKANVKCPNELYD